MKTMLRIAISLILLSVLHNVLWGNQVWTEPLELFKSDNVEFSGTACSLADGSTAFLYTALNDQCFRTLHCLVRDSQNQVVSDQETDPKALVNKVCISECASDGNIIIINEYGHYDMLKINPAGERLSRLSMQGFGGVPHKLLTDNQGGAYLLTLGLYSSHLLHFECQPSSGYNQQSNYVRYNLPFQGLQALQVSMILAANNDLFCAAVVDDALWLGRFNENLNLVSESTSWPDSSHVKAVRLVAGSAGEMYLAWYSFQSIDGQDTGSLKALRLGQDGQQIWDSPLTLYSTQEQIYPLDLQVQELPDAKVVSLICYTLSPSSGTKHLFSQCFDADGELYFTQTDCSFVNDDLREASIKLIPASDSSAYVLVQQNHTNLYQNHASLGAQNLDQNGFAWADLLPVDTFERLAQNLTFNAYPYMQDNGLQMIYQKPSAGRGDVLRKSLDTSGNLSPASTLISSKSVLINSPLMVALSDRIFVAWLEYTDVNNPYYGSIRYQFVSPEGSILLPEDGYIDIVQMFGEDITIKDMKGFLTEDGDILLTWAQYDRYHKVFGQLIDPFGTQLWATGGEPQAKHLANLIQSFSLSYKGSMHDGELYLSWKTAQDIRLQKVNDSGAVWSVDGLSIVQQQNYPGSSFFGANILAMKDNYLVYGGSNDLGTNLGSWTAVLRFDQNGIVQDEFAPGGIIVHPQTPGNYFYTDTNILLVDQGLLISSVKNLYSYSDYWNDWMPASKHGEAKMISPYGTMLWDAQSFDTWSKIIFVGADADGFYCACDLGDTSSRIRKLSYDNSNIWTLDIPGRFVAARQVNPERFICLNSDLKYLIFDTQGQSILTADQALSDKYTASAQLVSLDTDAYALWGWYKPAAQPLTYYSTLLMQGLNTNLVSNEDLHIPSVPDVSLSLPWPNPFKQNTSFVLKNKSSQPLSCNIYNIKGQKVKGLAVTHKAETTVRWNGHDEAGNPVGAGIYFIRVQTNKGKALVRKLVKL